MNLDELQSLMQEVAAGISDAIVEGRDFTFAPDDFRLGLKGAHQRQNLALALACLRQLRAFPLGDAELHSGVAAARCW